MGPTAAGKTTIGKMLARRLRWTFLDADDFHSAQNKAKMQAGVPLDDADRRPWLAAIHAALVAHDQNRANVVLACSALKHSYRAILSAGLNVQIVYLKASPEELRARIAARRRHFVSAGILPGQLADLEEPANALVISAMLPPEQIVAAITLQFRLAPPPASASNNPAFSEDRTLRRLFVRLIPFLFLLYLVAFLDRINVSFAAVQMKPALGFSDSAYGLGAGIFFAGYFFFQVPSNFILRRIGARRWIATLMILWGIASTLMIDVRTVPVFCALRFLLGAAEAGFFPGVMYYLGNWFPSAVRARTVAWFMTAVPFAGIVGAPLSGLLLNLRTAGLAGWQWLFLMEGIPALVLGAATFFYLPDAPERAKWLSPQEVAWLSATLNREKINSSGRHSSFWSFLARTPAIWLLAFVYFSFNMATYGITLWLPVVLQRVSAASVGTIGLFASIPYIASAVAMSLNALLSDRTGERRWHVALPMLAGAFSLAAAAYATQTPLLILCFTLALALLLAINGPFWALVAGVLPTAAAAPGIAVINSLGAAFGGFLGPYVIGFISQRTGSFRGALVAIAVMSVISALAIFPVPLPQSENRAPV